jgi:hypothetical protein
MHLLLAGITSEQHVLGCQKTVTPYASTASVTGW